MTDFFTRKINFKNLSVAFAFAAAFCWFIMKNNDAAIFFAAASFASLFMFTAHNTDIQERDAIYREIDTRCEDIQRQLGSMYDRIETARTEVESKSRR